MSEVPAGLSPKPDGYADWLTELKGRIHRAQQQATLAVDRELVSLYWQTGRDILARQVEQGWGAKVIDRLSRGLAGCRDCPTDCWTVAVGRQQVSAHAPRD